MRRLLLFLLALHGCGAQAPDALGPDVRSLTILHTNDLHAQLLPDANGRGGFAEMATAIRQEKERSEAAILLHAGDLVQGSPVSTIFKGLPVIEVANTLGIDVHTLGNHEFDYGWHQTRKFIETAEFPTISANVVNPAGELLAPAAYTIHELNGVRVGVIGVVTGILDSLTMAQLRGPWEALPVVETVRRVAAEIADEADLIVVLCHCTDDEDDAMLEQLSNVPVIISGHNHGGLPDPKERDGRVVAKVRAWGHELGRLDLEYDVARKEVVAYDWRRIEVGDRYEAEPETAKLVAHWERKVADIVDEPIGRAERAIGKNDLTGIIEKVMRRAAGADLAYMNRGGVRASIPSGEVLRRHIWNVLPFGNELAYGRVLGANLPNEFKNRPNIDPNREYVVATNNFIAAKWAERGVTLDRQGPMIRDLLIEWVVESKVVR